MNSRTVLAKASQPATPVIFDIPAGACDCHTHVFLDEREFPFAASRKYTPPPASIEALSMLHTSLGIQRVVIVQPSVYGLDNAATLHALRLLGPDRARGVAVIEDNASEAQLDELAAAGVRGVRVNLEIDHEGDAAKASAQLQRTAERVAGRGWHVQVYASLALLARCSAVIQALPLPVVLDHFAGSRPGQGPNLDGLDAVLNLVASGKAYVKLSAPYRCSSQADYADLEPLAQRLIATNPDRMLWGSDWPHPQPGIQPRVVDVCPPFEVDNGRVLDQLRQWTADDAVLHKILVDNPGRLYDFAD